MEPGKRPITSFAPSILLGADGLPEMLIGAGGGNRIVGFVTNAILRLRSGLRDAQQIISAPQVLNWSGVTDLEPALAHHAPGLSASGHWPLVRRMDGGTQGAVRNGTAWNGGADPRRDGVAMAV
jgi:gamma-glutamyltranspeptidase/glutathione hydrolase